jgi:hypothetical protein
MAIHIVHDTTTLKVDNRVVADTTPGVQASTACQGVPLPAAWLE